MAKFGVSYQTGADDVESSSVDQGTRKRGGNKYQPLQLEQPEATYMTSFDSPRAPLSDGFPSSSPTSTWYEYFQRKRLSYLCLFLPFTIIIVTLSALLIYERHHNKHSNSSNTASSTDSAWDVYRVTSTKGVVATDTEICSQIGVNILSQGGNAVDAAIAAKFCLSVISPASSGIGGGAYILIHNAATNQQEFIDCRETAPMGANENMFIDDPIKAQDGGLAIAVLGEVRGLYEAYKRHGSGKVTWKQLVTPSAILANEWIVSKEVHHLFDQIKTQLYSGKYPLLTSLYMKTNPKNKNELIFKDPGDIVNDPVLSKTLQNIAVYGPDYLYKTMAETLAKEIQDVGGIITANDIRNYQPLITEPLKSNISGYHYYGVGGSSSGGPAIIGILQFMTSIDEPLISLGNNYYHYLVECFKHIFAIRSNLGDPAYVNVTNVYNAILSNNYLNYLQHTFTSDLKTQSSLLNYGGIYNLQYLMKIDAGTSHLSILDADGNAVSMTSTINTYFGSKVISPSTGILFNNQMDDFSIPNAPNYFGLAPSPYNYPEPKKRPLSSMSPSILLDRHGRVRLIGGASGGPRIITATAQVILNYLMRGMDLLSAVKAPRVHSQLLPDSVDAENSTNVHQLQIPLPQSVVDLLKERGHHNVTLKNVGMGVTQFIAVDPDTLLRIAVSDPRKDGRPAAEK